MEINIIGVSVFKFKSIVAVLLLSSCLFFASFLSAESNSANVISQAKARNLVLQKYRQLYEDVYFYSSIDKKYYKFPLLDSSYFDYIIKTKCCLIVEGEPPAGVYVAGKVSLDGKWVELTRVGFAGK